jgi:DNA-binding beta-propeller fold protein YncE
MEIGHRLTARGRAGIAIVALALALACSGASAPAAEEAKPAQGKSPAQETVGRQSDERIVLPVPQTLTPQGQQVALPGMRPQVLALSPDGRLLAVSGKTNELLLVNPDTGTIVQRVALPIDVMGEKPQPVSPQILEAAAKNQVSFTGLIFSPDGRRIFLSNVEGDVKVFQVDAQGKVSGLGSLPLPPANAPRRKAEIPSGLALSSDGRRLYVCGNLSNTLLELDADSGRLLRKFDVGVAPYDVVLVQGVAYVSNWGGRRPGKDDLTGPAGRGTVVRVDPVRHIASEGSVSIIDLASGATKEVLVDLHAAALAVSPDKQYVVCANAGSDNLSVIHTTTGRLVETIWTRAKPSDLLGATPNALAFAPDGRTLYVANGTQNAIAVVEFVPEKRRSRLMGLIPVGWYPAAIAYDGPRRKLHVANIKGFPQRPPTIAKGPLAGKQGFNSHQYEGTLSLVPIPAASDLPRLSQMVWSNLYRDSIEESLQPPRKGQPPRAIPERIGEPSLIKHVVYIIKENRTFDQVLGDLPQGNGDPKLCIFGRNVSPNQHKLATEFVLLDNTYCAGILSADGHQWSTTAFGTDYLERSFAGFPRSYPDGMGEDESDALAYSPAGFLWDRAVAQRVSIRNYGEFMEPAVRWRDAARKEHPDFLACYRASQGLGDDVVFACQAMVPSLRPFSPTHYVGWDMDVPDQYRADVILRELREFEAKGQFPSGPAHTKCVHQ